jgi:hypothetical protein
MPLADKMLDRTDRKHLYRTRPYRHREGTIDLCVVPKPFPPDDIRGCVNLYKTTVQLVEDGHIDSSTRMVRWFTSEAEYENGYDRHSPVRVFVSPWIP